jgi:hypothetical protein
MVVSCVEATPELSRHPPPQKLKTKKARRRSVPLEAIVSQLATVEISNQHACSQAFRNKGLHQKKHKRLDLGDLA